MSLLDESIFGRQTFTARCDLKPSELNKNMYQTLDDKVKKRFSGVCIPKLGFIKPGSVQILSKQIGRYVGSHFTGNMTFYLEVSALITRPFKGQVIDAIVVSKHDTGVVAKNYKLPYTLFVPKMPNENNEIIDRIEKNSYIRVEVLDSELNPPDMDTSRAEFWVVCKINMINVSDIKRLDLPTPSGNGWLNSISNMNIVISDDLEAINNDREALSNEAYGTLQDTKMRISTINSSYVEFISKASRDVLNKELILQDKISHFKAAYAVCHVISNEITADGKQMSKIKVLLSTLVLYKNGEEYTVERDFTPNTITIFNSSKVDIIELWSEHVKYIVNPYETIRISHSYLKQLEKCGFRDLPKRDNSVSRSYYKMVELMDYLVQKKNMKMACIAESPGGFIQALVERRSRDSNGALYSNPPNDEIYGMSIPIENDPLWDKLKTRLVLENSDRSDSSYIKNRLISHYAAGSTYTLAGQYVLKNHLQIVIPSNLDLDEEERKLKKAIDKDLSKCSIQRENGKILVSVGSTLVAVVGAAEKDEMMGYNIMITDGLEDAPNVPGAPEVEQHTKLNLFSKNKGNILIKENRDLLYSCFTDRKADLVTADGGFERDKSASDTEELDTFKLLVAESVVALKIQAEKGCFLLKIYDMATHSTIGLLSLLSYCYDSVFVYKPRTSRNASSEKYVICKGFQPQTPELDKIIANLESILETDHGPGKYVTSILINNEESMNSMRQYNSIFMKKQGAFIDKGHEYAHEYIRLNGDPKKLHLLMQPHVEMQIAERKEFMKS